VTTPSDAGFRATYSHALDALSRRARSRAELERWLRQREHAPVHIAETIKRLSSLGYLDDAEYARAFARRAGAGRHMSRWRIQAELARQGVAREVIGAAILEVMADESLNERENAAAVALKKLRGMGRLAADVRRRRLYAFLSRRGYAAEIVRETVAGLLRDGA